MRSATRRRRRGFTLIEMLVVMVVLGVLAGIAVLKYIDLKRTASAAAVAAEFDTIKYAAYNYWAETETWPPDYAPGIVPAELVQLLPGSFTFSRTNPDYTLDWENFQVVGPGGNPGFIIGITVDSSDPELMNKLTQYLGTRLPFFTYSGRLTYVIMGPDGLV